MHRPAEPFLCHDFCKTWTQRADRLLIKGTKDLLTEHFELATGRRSTGQELIRTGDQGQSADVDLVKSYKCSGAFEQQTVCLWV